MANKNIELIQGDTLTLRFKVEGATGPIDFTRPDTRLYANVSDLSGRRVIAKFSIQPLDLVNGEFQIFLNSASSTALRGKHLWGVRYELGERTTTLVGGQMNVRVGA